MLNYLSNTIGLRVLSTLLDEDARTNRWACASWVGFFVVATCGLHWSYLTTGRVWGEDAIPILRAYDDFYVKTGFFEILSLPGTGYFQLGNNLTILILRNFVPLKGAATAIQMYTLFWQAVPLILVFFYRNAFRLRPLEFMLLSLLMLFSLQQYEITLSAAGLQFILSVSVGIILIAPATADWRAWATFPILMLGALTGIPSLCLLPFYGLACILEKNVTRWIQAVVMVLCALIQFSYVFKIGINFGGRQFGLTANEIVLASLYKLFALPLIGKALWFDAEHLLSEWRSVLVSPHKFPEAADLALYAGVLLVAMTLVYLIGASLHKKAWIAMGAALWLTLVSIFGALDGTQVLTFIGSGRYLYAPGILAGFAIVLAAREAKDGMRRTVAYSLLGWGIVMGAGALVSTLSYYTPVEPSWFAQIDSLKSATSKMVRTAPNGWELWFDQVMYSNTSSSAQPIDEIRLKPGQKLMGRFKSEYPGLDKVSITIGSIPTQRHLPWKLYEIGGDNAIRRQGETVAIGGIQRQVILISFPEIAESQSKIYQIEIEINPTDTSTEIRIPLYPVPTASNLKGRTNVSGGAKIDPGLAARFEYFYHSDLGTVTSYR